ncbi:MAG: Hsp20/alpha crystallin family protein [Sedimenticola sp.]
MTKTKEKKGQVVPRVSRSLTPFEEMDRLFNQLWDGGMLKPFGSRWPMWGEFSDIEERFPKVDIIDREDEVLVRAELPGMNKEDLDISLSDEYLTIKAETHQEKKEEGEYYRSEIHHGSFTRTVHLPAQVDGTKATASFDEGMLEVTIPKAVQRKSHKIEIN